LYGRCANQTKGILDVYTDTHEQKRFVMPAQFCFEITEGLLQEIAIHSNSDVAELFDLIENPINDLIKDIHSKVFLSLFLRLFFFFFSFNLLMALFVCCFSCFVLETGDDPDSGPSLFSWF